MNYIYFNEKGRLKKSTIDDLYQGSANVDIIYIFADFDKEETSEYEVSLTFRRSDNVVIGPVECVPDFQPNPINPDEMMRCYSFVLGNDILDVAGPLQITARYHSTYVDTITGEVEEAIKATAMVVANVNASVPLQSGTSTLLANINRRINMMNDKLTAEIEGVDDKLDAHIQEYYIHDHNSLYYQKEESDNKYAVKLEVDVDGNIMLINADNEVLSSIKVPTVIQVQPPGTLVHNGSGMFILQPNKEYLINIFSTLNVDLYLETGGADEPITYLKLTNNSGVFPDVTHNMPALTIQGLSMIKAYVDNFYFKTASTTDAEGRIIQNGTTIHFSAENLPFHIDMQNRCKIALNSTEQFQVYEV